MINVSKGMEKYFIHEKTLFYNARKTEEKIGKCRQWCRWLIHETGVRKANEYAACAIGWFLSRDCDGKQKNNSCKLGQSETRFVAD